MKNSFLLSKKQMTEIRKNILGSKMMKYEEREESSKL